MVSLKEFVMIFVGVPVAATVVVACSITVAWAINLLARSLRNRYACDAHTLMKEETK